MHLPIKFDTIINNKLIFFVYFLKYFFLKWKNCFWIAVPWQVTATDGDKDRPQNIVYFLTGQGIDPDNPANSKFDINRTTGEIFVLKVSFL